MSTNRTLTLTADRLREVLDYDSLTGVFRWKVRTTGGSKAGASAGGVNPRGYLKIKVDEVLHSAHRLAWLYVYGSWPTDQVDHINGNKTDNRIANLRDVDTATNTQNASGPRRNNKSGYRGVTYCPDMRRPWLATITVKGHIRRLGFFDTPQEAADAYVTAKRKVHPLWAEHAQPPT